jgi:hypothetical protein
MHKITLFVPLFTGTLIYIVILWIMYYLGHAGLKQSFLLLRGVDMVKPGIPSPVKSLEN